MPNADSLRRSIQENITHIQATRTLLFLALYNLLISVPRFIVDGVAFSPSQINDSVTLFKTNALESIQHTILFGVAFLEAAFIAFTWAILSMTGRASTLDHVNLLLCSGLLGGVTYWSYWKLKAAEALGQRQIPGARERPGEDDDDWAQFTLAREDEEDSTLLGEEYEEVEDHQQDDNDQQDDDDQQGETHKEE
jgi:hypothetical protein